jgi:hypothetical protein
MTTLEQLEQRIDEVSRQLAAGAGSIAPVQNFDFTTVDDLGRIGANLPGGVVAPNVDTYIDQYVHVGDSDDGAAVARAIADLGPSGGVIGARRRAYGFAAPWPSLAGRRSITIVGKGGLTAGAEAATRFIYSGAADPFVDARSSYGVRLIDLQVTQTNPAFTGKLLDWSHSTASDAAYGGVERCTLGGQQGGANNASAILSFDNAINCRAISSLFGYARRSIRGADVAGNYSNRHVVFDCSFGNTLEAPIQDFAQGCSIISCTFEPLIGGSAGAYLTNAIASTGLVILGGWMGDANATGKWVQFSGNALIVAGVYFSQGLTGVELGPSSFGNAVVCNEFDILTNAVVVGANCRDNVVAPNTYNGVTNKLVNNGLDEPNLRTVRGIVNSAGGIVQGAGFTVTHPSTGIYFVTYSAGFPAEPAVTVTPRDDSRWKVAAAGDGGAVEIAFTNASNLAVDTGFSFHAIGPR